MSWFVSIPVTLTLSPFTPSRLSTALIPSNLETINMPLDLEGMPTARGMIDTDCREARDLVQAAQILWGVK